MGRRPKIKTCADPACPAEFTGRGKFCEWHRAGRDKPGSKFRKARKLEQQQRRRGQLWERQNVKSPLHPEPSTGVKSPLHVSAGQGITKLGHVGRGPLPIDVTRTPGMTIGRAIDIFMIEWTAHRELNGGAE